MQFKTCELSGWKLDYAAALALNSKFGPPLVSPHKYDSGATIYLNEGLRRAGIPFAPTKDKRQCFEIMEAHAISPAPDFLRGNKAWKAVSAYSDHGAVFGINAAEAVLRCFVLKVIGESVDLPEVPRHVA